MSPRSNPPGRRPNASRRQREARRRDAPSSRAARSQRASGGPVGRRTDPRLIALVVVVGLALISGVYALGGLTGQPPVPTPGPAATAVTGSTPGPSDSGLAAACPKSQPAALAAGETRTVTIATAKGAIVIKVDGSLSPIAAGNFVALAQCGFYDGVVFHRLVPGFVIQGGDPAGNGSGGPGYTIADEPITATYHRGTVAMARTSQPNSQGSQFFIVLSDGAASSLAAANPGYAIFGEVTSGMDVVDAIAAMPNSGTPNNTALDPVAMQTVTVTSP